MYKPKQKTPNDYPIIVAIDWADQKHDFRIRRGYEIQTLEISSELKIIQVFFDELIEESNGAPIAIVIEKCRSGLMNLMLKIQELDIYAVHPTMASKFAQTFSPSGAKSDPADAQSLMELYLNHHKRLEKLTHSQTQSCLGRLNVKLRDVINERTRLTNQLTAHLKEYYPSALKIVSGSLYADMILEFLQKYPSPQSVLECHQIGLTKFFNKRSSKKELTRSRVQTLRDSVVVVEGDELDCYVFELLEYCKRITELNRSIKAYEVKVHELYKQNKDYQVVTSFPGAGPKMGPRIMAFFGNNRARFSCVEDALKASEIAPVKIQSGKMCIVRRRFLCDRFTQLTFVEFANNSRKSSLWAQEFYKQKKVKGMSHFCILRALAYKWIRIIFRCWKNQTPYDESVYLKALDKRPNSLFKEMVKS